MIERSKNTFKGVLFSAINTPRATLYHLFDRTFSIAWYFNQYPPDRLIRSFFSSLFYIHNFVFPGELPLVNGINWSLEVEVQYYILAPAFVWLVCQIKDKVRRRIFTSFLIIALAVLSWLIDVQFEINTVSLASYLTYFFCGILLCDLYLLEDTNSKHLNHFSVSACGLALLALIVTTEHVKSPSVLLRILSPMWIFGFYFVVLGNSWWRRIFRTNALTLIGGMCYTIYLLHYAVISAVTHHSINWVSIKSYGLFLFVQSLIVLPVVAVISVGFFLLVEKPCMKKNWPIELYNRLKLRAG